jgi:hypothetical protein
LERRQLTRFTVPRVSCSNFSEFHRHFFPRFPCVARSTIPEFYFPTFDHPSFHLPQHQLPELVVNRFALLGFPGIAGLLFNMMLLNGSTSTVDVLSPNTSLDSFSPVAGSVFFRDKYVFLWWFCCVLFARFAFLHAVLCAMLPFQRYLRICFWRCRQTARPNADPKTLALYRTEFLPALPTSILGAKTAAEPPFLPLGRSSARRLGSRGR